MKKQVVVLSLGGSLIIPDQVDIGFLQKFKKAILKNTSLYKFIVVCGGGSIARKYITALRAARLNEQFQNYSGISATRMNARFMNYLFGIDISEGIPHTLHTVEKYLKKHNIVFCGALEYKPKQTSDSTATEIARHFRTFFINLTDVAGLYDKNPRENKNAKLITSISWKEFNSMANKQEYTPGQHFVLDQEAARKIMEAQIPTYILGKDMKQFEAVLQGKQFKGTLVSG